MITENVPARRPFGDFIEDLDDLIGLAVHEDFPHLASLLRSTLEVILRDPRHYSAPTPEHLRQAEERVVALMARLEGQEREPG